MTTERQRPQQDSVDTLMLLGPRAVAQYLEEALRVASLVDLVKIRARVRALLEIAQERDPGSAAALQAQLDRRIANLYTAMEPLQRERGPLTGAQLTQMLDRMTSVQFPPVPPDFVMAAIVDLALQRKEDLRASPLYFAALGALTVLRNMAREEPVPWWAFWRSRWPIAAEPLRSDARHVVPTLEATLGVGPEGSEEDGE